ncbi:MAG TPA: hypothetical protein VFW92_05780 [Candidatus Limnocylindrales bacterium]|nr:hypothetical protein [Candidatus Limnocylindrales bacterium]
MQSGRAAIVIFLGFVLTGIVYYLLNSTVKAEIDPGGATMLIFAGVAMGFGFFVMLRGSREL